MTVLDAPAFIGPATYVAGEADLPVTNVSWEDAAAFCAWRDARLPTEAEWEYAARGDDANNLYPWGASKGEVAVNIDGIENAPVAVGSFPQSASPFGVEDMAGNVWEWTADWYAPDFYAQSEPENPVGPAAGEQKVLRGGGFRVVDFLGLDEARATHRRPLAPDQAADDIGFRCALDG